MPYTPPGVSAQSLAPGTHEVFLTGFKPIDDPAKLAKFAAQAVFIATYKSSETGLEIDQVIKFNGSRADFFAGQTIDRLHMAAGLAEPAAGEVLDIAALLIAIDGRPFLLEVNEKGYANSITVPTVEGGEEAF